MDAVYSSAYLTIVAADGDDAGFGLRRLERRPSTLEKPHRFTLRGGKCSFLPPRGGLRTVLQSSTWNTRAWTYQEHVLSRRCVFFADSEVFFTCDEGQCKETYQVQTRDIPSTTKCPPSRSEFHDRLLTNTSPGQSEDYESAVTEFSRHQMTDPGDRLDAFLGIFFRLLDLCGQSFSALSPDPAWDRNDFYFALSGVHWQHFVGNLLWQPSYPSIACMPPLVRTRYNAQRARYIPSWTWAGWSGTVRNDWGATFDKAYEVLLMNAGNIVLKALETEAESPWND